MATPASSGDPRNPTPHIALKPQAPGIETNLTIYTTRHIYHLVLRSRDARDAGGRVLLSRGTAGGDAPGRRRRGEGEAAEPRNRPQSIRPATATAASSRSRRCDPSQLNFSYKIDGPNVPWRPLRVFDDGSHVYLEMPAGMKSSEAPALLIAAGGGTQMVNYRVRGSYFVVDRLFEKGVLLAGVGRQQDRVRNRVRGRSEVRGDGGPGASRRIRSWRPSSPTKNRNIRAVDASTAGC